MLRSSVLPFGLVLASTLVGSAPLRAQIVEFPVPTAASRPYTIAAGPDGNLWFTESMGNKIGRITPAGVITEFTVPMAGSGPYGICVGPDGNIWFTERFGNQIGRLAGPARGRASRGTRPGRGGCRHPTLLTGARAARARLRVASDLSQRDDLEQGNRGRARGRGEIAPECGELRALHLACPRAPR